MNSDGIVAATEAYEGWLRSTIPVWDDDLEFKHGEMSVSPFAFLRSTYYWWVVRWTRLFPGELAAPVVLAVGDLHVENFGTWRDSEARLVWGVNDLDEVAPMPYTADLVRLATSARLALKAGDLVLTTSMACQSILDGYTETLRSGGTPILLEERDAWLRRMVTGKPRDPALYWRKVRANAPLDRPVRPALRHALVRALPHGILAYELRRRRAGLGSLGRERVLAEGEWDGGPVAREVKSLVSPAWGILASKEESLAPGEGVRRLLAGAVRSPDPCLIPGAGHVVRRLAPDCSRIPLAEMAGRRDDVRFLRAMGRETGNLHLASPAATEAVLQDLETRPAGWLESEARRMSRATLRDWREWRLAHARRPR